MSTGYEPLNTLKPIATDIWLIDGPAIKFYGLPFSTRATVVRLANDDLWVHSPTKLTDELAAEVRALGPVAHLIAPNWIHYAYVAEWQAAFPDAVAWAAPGVVERAASRGMDTAFDHDLRDTAEEPWHGQIDQLYVRGSKVHHEVVFLHRVSQTLVLTDLIENFEAVKLSWWMRVPARLAGVLEPGSMPRDMRFMFRNGKKELRGAVEQMIAWEPKQVIVAHGRWYERDGAAELRRAFAFLW